MKTTKTLIISALGLLGLASACTVDTDATAEDIGANEAAACENFDGTNATMAALAAATAKQLRRWQPKTDFVWNETNGLMLTTAGKNRCTDNKLCKNVQAILDFQRWDVSGKVVFPGGAVLKSDTLRERLYSRMRAQITCIDRIDNNDPSNCPAEAHDLVYSSATPGVCATDYWFHAYKAGTTQPLALPAQLKNMLLWVGYDPAGGTNSNPYLAFDVQGDDVKIDPTGGPVEGDPAASGSCPAVCSKYSTTNIANSCCSCNSVTKKFAQLVGNTGNPVPNMYVCQ